MQAGALRRRNKIDDSEGDVFLDQVSTGLQDDLGCLFSRHRQQAETVQHDQPQALVQTFQVRKKILAQGEHDAIGDAVEFVLSREAALGLEAFLQRRGRAILDEVFELGQKGRCAGRAGRVVLSAVSSSSN